MNDLKDKAISIKGKDYVLVKDRILALAESGKPYSIETGYKYLPERKMWIVKAKLTIGENVYNGLAQEIETGSGVNQTSALENAETSAVGRACAMAGIGVLDSIASVDEINKATNRAPAPQAPSGFKCIDCGADKIKSSKGNLYCSAKCWLEPKTSNTPPPSMGGQPEIAEIEDLPF